MRGAGEEKEEEFAEGDEGVFGGEPPKAATATGGGGGGRLAASLGPWATSPPAGRIRIQIQIGLLPALQPLLLPGVQRLAQRLEKRVVVLQVVPNPVPKRSVHAAARRPGRHLRTALAPLFRRRLLPFPRGTPAALSLVLLSLVQNPNHCAVVRRVAFREARYVDGDEVKPAEKILAVFNYSAANVLGPKQNVVVVGGIAIALNDQAFFCKK